MRHLGLEVRETVGHMLSRFIGSKAEIPPGLTKEAYLEYQLHGLLVESPGLDLLVMGRGEGPGCYCYPNLILRKFVDELAPNYAHLVIDNEAGMEHLSRRTTRRIDSLVVVAEHSVKAARAAGRINQLVDELKLDVDRRFLLLNKVPGEPAPEVLAEIENSGLELIQALPYDEELARADAEGRPIVELPASNPTYDSLAGVLPRIVG